MVLSGVIDITNVHLAQLEHIGIKLLIHAYHVRQDIYTIQLQNNVLDHQHQQILLIQLLITVKPLDNSGMANNVLLVTYQIIGI